MNRYRARSLVAGAALAVASFAIAAGGPAHAYEDCKDGTIGGWSGTPSAKGHITVPIADALYLDVREVMGTEYTWSIWLYQESNGKAGLQRGGNSANGPLGPVYEPTVGNGSDPCSQGTPDTIIF